MALETREPEIADIWKDFVPSSNDRVLGSFKLKVHGKDDVCVCVCMHAHSYKYKSVHSQTSGHYVRVHVPGGPCLALTWRHKHRSTSDED